MPPELAPRSPCQAAGPAPAEERMCPEHQAPALPSPSDRLSGSRRILRPSPPGVGAISRSPPLKYWFFVLRAQTGSRGTKTRKGAAEGSCGQAIAGATGTLLSECVSLGWLPLRCGVSLCHRSAPDGQACGRGRRRALTLVPARCSSLSALVLVGELK